ncbi:conserved hypothetical protein [Ricinus communis]|uniref:Glycosyltransferase 2-like domain-containing protein n=1 Tax=Ricinus communis TaxID=3988 RepID=B9TFB7_RICCO|nr:conserved hypothetical protein [Ricinus communis]
MLQHTLPVMKQCVDEIIVVDMGSDDRSFEIYEEFLTEVDRVVSYPRSNLFAFGFAHPRNYGGQFARADWVLAIDSDELVEPEQVRALRQLNPGATRAFNVTRNNYQKAPRLDLQNLDQLIKGAPFTVEKHRRFYRNDPAMRWEGLIHEEIWDGGASAYATAGEVDVTLHHLNAYKTHGSAHEKQLLYSYITLKAVAFPRFQYGTNEYWFTTFVQENFSSLVEYANAFSDAQGLPRLPMPLLTAALNKLPAAAAS